MWFDHAIMNLPQTAIDFLDVFRGLLYTKGKVLREPPPGKLLPMVHVYCFEKEPEADEVGPGVPTAAEKAVARAEAALGVAAGALAGKVDVHVVRDVAPKKPMLCLSFRLPDDVARSEPVGS